MFKPSLRERFAEALLAVFEAARRVRIGSFSKTMLAAFSPGVDGSTPTDAVGIARAMADSIIAGEAPPRTDNAIMSLRIGGIERDGRFRLLRDQWMSSVPKVDIEHLAASPSANRRADEKSGLWDVVVLEAGFEFTACLLFGTGVWLHGHETQYSVGVDDVLPLDEMGRTILNMAAVLRFGAWLHDKNIERPTDSEDIEEIVEEWMAHDAGDDDAAESHVNEANEEMSRRRGGSR